MKLKYFIILVIYSSLIYGQNVDTTFEGILDKIKLKYYQKDYSSALELVEKLKTNISKKGNELVVQQTKSSEEFEKDLRSFKSPLVFNIGKKIKVHFGENIIYVITEPNISDYNRLFVEPIPIEVNKKLAIENRFIEINGETKVIHFSTSDTTIGTITTAGYLSLVGAGDFYVNITIDKTVKKIPFRVIQIPLEDGSEQEEVILKYGLPQKKTKKFLDFDDYETIDGISYYVDDIYGESVEHWIYNKFPTAVFRFDVMGLKDIVQPKWSGIRVLMYSLEHD